MAVSRGRIEESRSPFHAIVLHDVCVGGLTLYDETRGRASAEASRQREFLPSFAIHPVVRDNNPIGLRLPIKAIEDTDMNLGDSTSSPYPKAWCMGLNSYEEPTLLILTPAVSGIPRPTGPFGDEVVTSDLVHFVETGLEANRTDVKIKTLYIWRSLIRAVVLDGANGICLSVPYQLLRARLPLDSKSAPPPDVLDSDPVFSAYALFDDGELVLVYGLMSLWWNDFRSVFDTDLLVETAGTTWPHIEAYRRRRKREKHKHSIADFQNMKSLLTGGK